ncbi:hypothetical protein F4561_005407 [Lipingzhangella halophila]|uniref:Uncharacterized protein n=1 Tax=Lipingzhangella halophila TaxID=1783352 RepID=A0A7W7W4W1_9ACTN|nr:hypothetical protein [Lipingzhangella halophila]
MLLTLLTFYMNTFLWSMFLLGLLLFPEPDLIFI